jgi:hypothetical protein
MMHSTNSQEINWNSINQLLLKIESGKLTSVRKKLSHGSLVPMKTMMPITLEIGGSGDTPFSISYFYSYKIFYINSA